ACRCLFTSTVDAAFAQSENVIAVRFEGIRELNVILDKTIPGPHSALMTVEKVYKGKLREREVIKVYSSGQPDCSLSFNDAKQGDKFLFFTGPAGKIENLTEDMYRVGSCSRSTSLAAAAHDFEYLDDVKKRIGKTRLSGT